MKGYASAKVVLSAYALAAVFLSNPDYYLGAPLSLLLAAVAYRCTTDPANRKLVAISYLGASLLVGSTSRTAG